MREACISYSIFVASQGFFPLGGADRANVIGGPAVYTMTELPQICKFSSSLLPSRQCFPSGSCKPLSRWRPTFESNTVRYAIN